jgi:hypothetical protein
MTKDERAALMAYLDATYGSTEAAEALDKLVELAEVGRTEKETAA